MVTKRKILTTTYSTIGINTKDYEYELNILSYHAEHQHIHAYGIMTQNTNIPVFLNKIKQE